jgi:hypothetical protein
MTVDLATDSFGPYAFTLSPSEAEAAAARAGLRTALKDGLLMRHVAPLTAFALIMTFASVLALTGLISQRTGEATLILAAAAFMIQRLITHWRVSRARLESRAGIARLQAAGALTAKFENGTVSLDVDGRTMRLRYADCAEAEDAGGLIYIWPHYGAPIVVPTRAITNVEEAARLVSRLSGRIAGTRRTGLVG